VSAAATLEQRAETARLWAATLHRRWSEAELALIDVWALDVIPPSLMRRVLADLAAVRLARALVPLQRVRVQQRRGRGWL